MVKRFTAELFGTAVLVFFACGVATLSFGKFKTGTFLDKPIYQVATGSSHMAGVVATALAFGLILAALAYSIGPISGCHVNPAVTLGALFSGRMNLQEAASYWIAQFLGGFGGAVLLWFAFKQAPGYNRHVTGLGADGYAANSYIHLNAGGAFLVEVIMTAMFVYLILEVTSKQMNAAIAGLIIGFTLAVIHLFGINLTGTSVNPARSLGPALIVGGEALKQVWLFIVAPIVGGALAAVVYKFLNTDSNVIKEIPDAQTA